MEMRQNSGYSDRHDHAKGVTNGTRLSICQRTVGEHLPASARFIIRLRLGNLCEPPCNLVGSLLKETRTMGGVGAGDCNP